MELVTIDTFMRAMNAAVAPLHFSSVKQGGIVPVLVRRLAVTDPVHFSSVKHGCLRALPDAGGCLDPLALLLS